MAVPCAGLLEQTDVEPAIAETDETEDIVAPREAAGNNPGIFVFERLMLIFEAYSKNLITLFFVMMMLRHCF